MEDDPFDLIFARNVRLWLGKTETNKEIQVTFKKSPKEFAYSNNGITILCKSHNFDPGKKELRLENPRTAFETQIALLKVQESWFVSSRFHLMAVPTSV